METGFLDWKFTSEQVALQKLTCLHSVSHHHLL
jgi:hypothetical protein